MRWIWIVNVIMSVMSFSHHKPSIQLTPTPQTNEILHNWMTDISQSPYLTEHEINPNNNQLVGLTRGLIMTTDVSNSKSNETLMCFVVKKEAKPVAVGITILVKQDLYLDNICFSPGIDENQDYYK